MKQLVEFFQNRRVASALDIGTGSGDFVDVLMQALPGARIEGVDPNNDALDVAREKYPGFVFTAMAAEKLDYANDSFDLASISMALHHLPDVQRSLKEMQRIVRPGGWIIVSELFSDNLSPAQEVHKMYHHFRSRIDRILGVSHNKTFRKDEILTIVRNSGIDVQTYFEFNKGGNQLNSSEDLEALMDKMRAMLESVKEYPEYVILQPQIDEFRKRATAFGFASATRVVIIGQNNSRQLG